MVGLGDRCRHERRNPRYGLGGCADVPMPTIILDGSGGRKSLLHGLRRLRRTWGSAEEVVVEDRSLHGQQLNLRQFRGLYWLC